jgi:ribosomal protein L7/L12
MSELPERALAAIRDAMARGAKIEAIKLYRQATGARLRESKEAVERMESETAAEPPPVLFTGPLRDEDLARLRTLLRRGETLQAVKFHRERTGYGLKESKDAVDALEREIREGLSPRVGQPAGGCLGVHLAVVF